MALVSGILLTSNTDPDDLVGEWQEGVLVRNARGQGCGSLLFPLMTKLSVEQVDSHKFNWWERDPSRLTLYSNAGFNDSVTTLTWDDGAGNAVFTVLSTGTILANKRTGEYVRVTANPTTANVTVSRGEFSTTAATINDNDTWTIVTKASGEAGTIRRANYEEPSDNYNYIQRHDETVDLSDLLMLNRLRTDNDGPLTERRLQALERISNSIEMSFFDGKRGAISTSDGNMYFSGGIKDGVDTAGLTDQVLNGNGASGVEIDDVHDWMHSYLVNGSPYKIAFCGNLAYGAISKWANSAESGFRFGPSEHVYGMHIRTLETPFGSIDLCMHPQFKTSIAHQGSIYSVDLGLLTQKTGAPLQLFEGCEGTDEFGHKENFRFLGGLKMKFPEAFGYAYDFQKIIPNS